RGIDDVGKRTARIDRVLELSGCRGCIIESGARGEGRGGAIKEIERRQQRRGNDRQRQHDGEQGHLDACAPEGESPSPGSHVAPSVLDARRSAWTSRS